MTFEKFEKIYPRDIEMLFYGKRRIESIIYRCLNNKKSPHGREQNNTEKQQGYVPLFRINLSRFIFYFHLDSKIQLFLLYISSPWIEKRKKEKRDRVLIKRWTDLRYRRKLVNAGNELAQLRRARLCDCRSVELSRIA